MDEALWVTKGSRFLCSKKYKMIYLSLLILSSLLTFLLICIAIIKISEVLPINIESKYVDIVLLIVSIFLFSLSFYLPLLSNKVNVLHNNAANISSLLHKLKLAKSEKDLKKISTKYNIYEKQINHDTIDYRMWCNTITHEKHKNSCFLGTIYFLLWHFLTYFIYLLLIIIGVYIYSNFRFYGL